MAVDFRRRGVGDNAKGILWRLWQLRQRLPYLVRRHVGATGSGRMAVVEVQLPRGNDPRGGSYPWGFYSQIRPSDSEGNGPFPAFGVDGGGDGQRHITRPCRHIGEDGEEVMILAVTTLGMVAASGSLRPDPTM
uniref:Uncharacterized protein n=1 Tax=Oryza meridionalis TaxID=40149 RepID=A0A0E0E4N1_9ORYZ